MRITVVSYVSGNVVVYLDVFEEFRLQHVHIKISVEFISVV
jgi:hypothetical protein